MKADAIGRVPTGIPGFDEMVGGGFERGSTTLLVGGCGSGKSTIAMQYLYNGATRYGENGVYVTFEEKPDKLKARMRNFGWDLDDLEGEGKLRVARIPPSDAMNMIKENYGRIMDEINEIKAKRVVIDSISSLESMLPGEFERRENSIRLCERLSDCDCTSVVVSESEQTLGSYTRHGVMEFVVDSVIVLYNIQRSGKRESALEVLKMRGTMHSKRIVPFKIDRGVTVYPDEEIFGKEG